MLSDVGFVQSNAIYRHCALLNLNNISRNADHPLYEVTGWVSWEVEDYHLSMLRLVEGEQRAVFLAFDPGQKTCQRFVGHSQIDDLVDQQILALCEGWLHAGAFDPEILDAELQHQKYQKGKKNRFN